MVVKEEGGEGILRRPGALTYVYMRTLMHTYSPISINTYIRIHIHTHTHLAVVQSPTVACLYRAYTSSFSSSLGSFLGFQAAIRLAASWNFASRAASVMLMCVFAGGGKRRRGFPVAVGCELLLW